MSVRRFRRSAPETTIRTGNISPSRSICAPSRSRSMELQALGCAARDNHALRSCLRQFRHSPCTPFSDPISIRSRLRNVPHVFKAIRGGGVVTREQMTLSEWSVQQRRATGSGRPTHLTCEHPVVSRQRCPSNATHLVVTMPALLSPLFPIVPGSGYRSPLCHGRSLSSPEQI